MKTKPMLLSWLGLCVSAACLVAQPTDNPVAQQYAPGEYPVWVNSIAWDNVIDMSTYANGADNFAKFENARDELHAQGGGVLYYPAGTYVFNLPDTGYGPGIGTSSRGLMLKSGVVIRGADLAPGADQAVVRTTQDITNTAYFSNVSHTLNPQTVFEFPTQTRGTTPITLVANSAGEVPRDWSFIGMVTGNGESTLADVNNIGVVNVTLSGGTIFFGFHTPRSATLDSGFWLQAWKNNWPAGAPLADTWAKRVPDGTHYMDGINGANAWHAPVYAGSGRLVMGVKIVNGAPFNDMLNMDLRTPAQTQALASAFAHYRFSGRIFAYGSEIFIANNVMSKPTKNFVHVQKQNSVGDRVILFDYANHIGIDVNKNAFGGHQNSPTVVGANTGYYFPNVIVRDNYVFSRGNKGYELSGTWVTNLNNHNERFYAANIFPFDYITNPEAYPGATLASGINAGGISFDGWAWQTNESASDYMSRGHDLGGNSIWAHRNSVTNTGSRGNDGEAIMGQRHNNIEVYSWAFTYNSHGNVNKGPGTFGEPGWVGLWDMHAAGFLLFNNVTTGAHGILFAAGNWLLDVTVTPNMGPGSTSTPTTTHPASQSGDYQAIHANSVSAPDNVQAIFLSGGQGAQVSWVDTASNELGFRVERKIGEGDWQVIAYRPAQNLGKNSNVIDPYTGSRAYPELNPEIWVDYLVDDSMSLEYRVIAFNSLDDNSTGVSAVAVLGSGGAPLVAPMAVGVAMDGSDLAVSFQSVAGLYYQLQSSPDMGTWTNVGSAVAGNGAEMEMAGPAPVSGGTFYRLAVSNQP